MTTTTRTSREGLVSELKNVRVERDNANRAVRVARGHVKRIEEERDHLRKQLIEAETIRAEQELELTHLRQSFDRVTALMGVRESEVLSIVSSLNHALLVLQKPVIAPNRNAMNNQRDLVAALKEKKP